MRKKIRRSLKKFKSDLREEQCFEIFALIGSNVNQKLRKSLKVRKCVVFFSKMSISTLGHIQGNLQLKFEEILLIGSEIIVTQIVNGDTG